MDVDDLLQKTSRTFALAIPLLPAPTRDTVSLAYLLMRIVDTFEDASVWPRERRVEALEAMNAALSGAPETWALAVGAVSVVARQSPLPSTHQGYLELLEHAAEVAQAVARLPPAARSIVQRTTCSMARGMSRFVARADETGTLELADLPELANYCFFAAGLVGELLTDLFLLDAPRLAPAGPELRRTMHAFGEGLQLVNILKDAGADARERRVFLPARVPVEDVMALASCDLDDAASYVTTLQRNGAPKGFVAFTGVCLTLARRTLDALELQEPKLSRSEVMEAVAAFLGAVETERPIAALLSA